MEIKSRKSIHKDSSYTNKSAIAPSYGSQEHLSKSDNSDLTSSNDETNIENPNLAASRRKTKRQSTPAARKESPIGQKSLRSDSLSDNAEQFESKTKSFPWFWLIAVGAIVCFVIFCGLGQNGKQNTLKKCTYSNLQVKYPREDNRVWRVLKSGIEDLLNGQSDMPAVYLFVHNDSNVAKELIRDIASASSSCFGSAVNPVEIGSVDFSSKDAVEDYGHVIVKYKEKVKEGNVILIANLNEIPPQAARALHVICDTISPIVRKVIIFLSLVAENKGEKTIDTAVDALLQLWETTIARNELDPLITRVTDEVILLQSE